MRFVAEELGNNFPSSLQTRSDVSITNGLIRNSLIQWFSFLISSGKIAPTSNDWRPGNNVWFVYSFHYDLALNFSIKWRTKALKKQIKYLWNHFNYSIFWWIVKTKIINIKIFFKIFLCYWIWKIQFFTETKHFCHIYSL